jgi:hypothetical protein
MADRRDMAASDDHVVAFLRMCDEVFQESG